MCSDSQGDCGYIYQGNLQKIRRVEHERFVVAAFSGIFPEFDVMLEFALNDGSKPSFEDDSQLILIDKEGIAWEFWAKCHGCMKMGIPAAGGTGCKFAMGAMLSGANALRAVEIAIKLDCDSGGPVQCYDIKTGVMTGPFGNW